MVGVLLGTMLGAVEFYLLRKLVNQITAGEIFSWWLIPAKLGALVLFLVPCGLLAPKELPLAGISVGVVLIIGAGVQFLHNMNKQKKAAEAAANNQGKS